MPGLPAARMQVVPAARPGLDHALPGVSTSRRRRDRTSCGLFRGMPTKARLLLAGWHRAGSKLFHDPRRGADKPAGRSTRPRATSEDASGGGPRDRQPEPVGARSEDGRDLIGLPGIQPCRLHYAEGSAAVPLDYKLDNTYHNLDFGFDAGSGATHMIAARRHIA